MEYKYLLKQQNEYSDINKEITNKNKYKKILDNLLGISSRDNAIFFKFNDINDDLLNFLSPEQVVDVFNKSKFRLKIDRQNTKELIDKLDRISNFESLSNFIDNIQINKKRKLKDLIKKYFNSSSKEDLKEVKQAIKSALKQEEADFLKKWKIKNKRINDSFDETNIWQLFIGSYFIKVQILVDGYTKQLYAPLLLKEVCISISGNDVFLESRNSGLIFNEKLIFFLEQNKGINFPRINNLEEEISLHDISLELDDFLKEVIEIEDYDPFKKVKEFTPISITNTKMEKISGFCLISCNAGASILRNVVINLIKKDKLNDLLKIDTNNFFDKDNNILKKLIIEREGIARICPTDLSQEKAIISSLSQHTIIKGPPGTGKSQTIANLLANIMLRKQRALVISQKKVALDVIVERLRSLNVFCFKILEENNDGVNTLTKDEFYNQFKKLFQIVSDRGESGAISLTSSITTELNDYWNSMDVEDNHTIFDFYYFLKENHESVLKVDANLLKKAIAIVNILDDVYKDEIIERINEDLSLDEFASLLCIQKIWVNKNDENYESDRKKHRLFHKKVKDVFEPILDFSDSTKKIYQEFLNLQDIFKSLEIDLYIFKKFISFQDHLDDIFLINNHSAQQKIFLDEIYKYHSDEQKIKNSLANYFYEKFNNIFTSDNLQKFWGKIERGHVSPRTFTRYFKDILRRLFDIVISTPDSLASFIDFDNDHYDYVIFDEASQIFLEKAIPFMSIADKVIIAGDDQQMQPSNWFGIRSSDSEDDDFQDSEEKVDSLLIYGIEKGLFQNLLELNYRSQAADLTTFSSKEFYDKKLKSVDKNICLGKTIEVYNVDGKWEESTNEIEIRKCLEILTENLNKYNKIILLTFNKKQEELFELYITQEYPEIYDYLISKKVILKSIENIQGDEADLVIVSVAYTKDTYLQGTYVARPGGRNALNVAVTRAKEKMIVVKSIKSFEIKSNSNNIDLNTFRSWIEFLELSDDAKRSYAVLVEDENGYDSLFEKDVVEWLKRNKFDKKMTLKTQYNVGSYRIDVALLDKNTDQFLLGIEIDGYKYHSSPKQKYNDFLRQMFLKSKGYNIIRVSEMLWKTDRSSIIPKINDAIQGKIE